MKWWRRNRPDEPRLTGKFVGKDGKCAGCGPWCDDHGWKVPEPSGNPEADLAAARAFAARVNAYLPVARNDA